MMIRLSSSIYALKPGFQRLLNPLRDKLIHYKVTPNAITIFSCVLCVFYPLVLLVSNAAVVFLIFLPFILLFRMMLNALDGMVASATDKQSPMGAVLNELCDVISDLALFAAFLLILPLSQPVFPGLWFWWLLMVINILIEFTALAVYQAIGVRPFSGPFGKSDRALYLGLLAIILLIYPDNEVLINTYIMIGLVLAVITMGNRLKVLRR